VGSMPQMPRVGPDAKLRQSHQMALVWLALFVALNTVVALAGPKLAAFLPKRPWFADVTGQMVLVTDGFEQQFARNSVSLPRRQGERRVVLCGDSRVANPAFTEALRAALRRRDPRTELYSIAWWGMQLSSEVPLIHRALDEQPDLLVWEVHPAQAEDPYPMFPSVWDPAQIVYGRGPLRALANCAHADRYSARLMVADLKCALLPCWRYRPTAQALVREFVPIELSSPAGDRAPHKPFARHETLQSPELAVRALEPVAAMARDRDIAFCVVLLTGYHSADGSGLYQREALEAYASRLREWASRRGVAIIDPNAAIPVDAYGDDWGHFRPAAFGEVAEVIGEQLLPVASEGWDQ
jgi:hypothetical protein